MYARFIIINKNMTQSVTGSLVSNLLKNNLKIGVCQFIKQYNTTNISYLRKSRDLSEGSDSNLPRKKLIGTKQVKNVKSAKKNTDIDIAYAKVVLTLVKTLDVTRDNALSTVKKYQFFTQLSRSTIIKNYYILRNADVNKSTLRIHMYALANSTKDLRTKIECLNEAKLDLNTAIALFQLPVYRLRTLAIFTMDDRVVIPEFNNRVEYLASSFGCSLEEICSALLKNDFMLAIQMKKLKDVTDLILDKGMLGEHILKDLHLYKFNIENIKDRIDKAKQAGIKQLKPWVVRCPAELLDKLKNRQTEQLNLIKPHNEFQDFLNSYFNVDKDLIAGLLRRDPKLVIVDVEKLSEVLNFLISKGYQFEEIFLQYDILHYAVKTLQERYDKWIQFHNDHPPLSRLRMKL